MKIHEFSIKRPVTILMCVCIVLVLGGMSLLSISVDLMPAIDMPIAIVTTTYSGVGPQEIENIVTKNIESALATVNNIKTIQSQSSEGVSMVIARFNQGTDMNFATLQMREKIDMIKSALPDDVSSPMVIKADPSMMPIASIAANGKADDVELKNFIEDKIKSRLESINGVASVSVTGGKTREIKVDVNPQKLAGYQMSFNNITGALQSENLNLPGGTVEYGDKNLLIRTTGEFKGLEQIENIPIMLPTGNIVYIRDVADVKDDFKDISSHTRLNNADSIGITVQKQTDANTVKVVNLLKEELKKIEAENPDVNLKMIFDQGNYIENSISNVAQSAITGGILAALVLFLFLRNIRSTLIIITSIPISIIATFTAVYFSGITLNIISLSGLAIGVGMMVDSSIVVLENIYRFRSEGYSRVEAALKGTSEVGSAVIASALTTGAVFLPIVFVEGMAGQVFKELALTVTFSLGASLVVSLTLVTMLSSKFLKLDNPSEKANKSIGSRLFDTWGNLLKMLDSFYRSVLVWVLKHRKTTAIIVIAVFVSSLATIPIIGVELMPSTDQGRLTVDIELVQGAKLEETDKISEKIEHILTGIPEMESVFANVGTSGSSISLSADSTNTATISGTLKPLAERNRSTAQVVDEIRSKTKNIAGADISVSEVSSSMGGSSSTPISIKISGPDLDRLDDIAAKVVEVVQSVEGTRQVESSISEGRPEAQIYVNRNKASYYGIGTSQVASAIRTTISGQVATRYKVDGDEIDVRVQLPKEKVKDFQQLKSIKITNSAGMEVSLSEVADIVMEEGPFSISRENQQRYVEVTSDIFGRDVGSIGDEIESKLAGISLGSEYSITFGGEQQDIAEAFSGLFKALILAILLVYMIMASQFESLLHPFIIMFSIPLAYAGSLLGLLITGRSLSMTAFIGIIMLAGIVVNNAIVLIDYINTLRSRGMEMFDAIIKAGPTRLRPILMTTLTTILGLLPMAFGLGEGGETQAPMATVVIGGLVTSTMLTLLIIPVIYTFVEGIKGRLKRKKKKLPEDEQAVTC